MATAILRPTGAQTIVAGTPVVAGATPWADDSDATYVDLKMQWASPFSFDFMRADQIKFVMDTFAGDPAAVTEIAVRLRAKGTTNDPRGDRLALYIGAEPSAARVIVAENGATFAGGGWILTADGSVHDQTVTLTDAMYAAYGTNLATVATGLAAGTHIDVRNLTPTGSPTGSFTTDTTIYEFAVIVTYGAAPVAYLPHARLEPRSDGGGGLVSSRLFPVKSEQHSPRIGPGSYY